MSLARLTVLGVTPPLSFSPTCISFEVLIPKVSVHFADPLNLLSELNQAILIGELHEQNLLEVCATLARHHTQVERSGLVRIEVSANAPGILCFYKVIGISSRWEMPQEGEGKIGEPWSSLQRVSSPTLNDAETKPATKPRDLAFAHSFSFLFSFPWSLFQS
ncbi:uncharacterized protein EV422DRAFT_516509 [Fimicolochytrium jonesii]|uniref:uncharacterized protein n=1 Tax=Fimicolochytrium jonesii TaxID=1396493 RepID=UPI0022FE0977|nr:uncharacterized protein EV422DRAFT_516509 [Fimicolochytrium jonesii]KAI8824879.1 hypothetical protein EV422DRAFT_516509 [Fimicolochytrium jonesii]